MSLGPREATVKLMLGGMVADEFFARYQRAIVQAMNATIRWVEDLRLDIPRATEDLRRSFEVQSNLYGPEKTFKVGVYSPYAEFILETGRAASKYPPPWSKIKEWAAIKGVDLRKAWMWWRKYGRQAKKYKSPRGADLTGWWSTQMQQLKYVLERELKAHLQAAGFSMQDVQVSYR